MASFRSRRTIKRPARLAEDMSCSYFDKVASRKAHIAPVVSDGVVTVTQVIKTEPRSDSDDDENSDGGSSSSPRHNPQWSGGGMTLNISNVESMYKGHESPDTAVDRGPNRLVMEPDQPMADSTPSSVLPSNKTWPGKYNFNIAFQEPPLKMTKSTSWTYSESLEKLFINMGYNCIVSFKVDSLPPPGCIIRALPIFEKAEHIIEIVRRCPTHCQLSDISNAGHSAPDHLVRCDNELAQYTTDGSGRPSVIVPFEPPQAGADNSEYLYKFMCFGSCVGGLNRRPLMLIFTLERNGEVLGRRPLRVRICACPGRDRKTEERNIERKIAAAATPGPAGLPRVNQTTTTEIISIAPPPNKRLKTGDDEVFTLTVKGRANYEVLKNVRDALELADMVPKDTVNAYKNQQIADSSPRNAIGSSEGVQQDRPALVRLGSSSAIPSTSTAGTSRPSAKSAPPISHGQSLVGSDPFASRPQPACFSRTENHSEEIVDANLAISNQILVKTEPAESVESWLDSIGMSAYVDVFSKNKLTDLSQLQSLDRTDQAELLADLKIGEAHQKIILGALQEHDGMLCGSQASTFSGLSQNTTGSASGHQSYYQFSRFKFKRVKSFKLTDE